MSQVYSSDFEDGSLGAGELVTDRLGTIQNTTEKSFDGTRSIKFTAPPTEQRCEWAIYHDQMNFFGIEFFCRYKMFLPSISPLVSPGLDWGFRILFQWEGSYGSRYMPILAVMAKAEENNGRLLCSLNPWYAVDNSTARTVCQSYVNIFDLVGRWVDFAFWTRIGESDGAVRVWIDQQEIMKASGINTSVQGTRWYINPTIYRSNVSGTDVMFLDKFEVLDGINWNTPIPPEPPINPPQYIINPYMLQELLMASSLLVLSS